MTEKNAEEKGFQVKDRRFSARQEEPERAEKGESAATGEEQETPPSTPEQPSRADGSPLPEISFSTFVLSLNSSVLVHLGFLSDPSTGQKQKNLPLAKQTIDLLGMLEEKTVGNLSSEEAQMLKNILYDLRISYIRVLG